MYASIESVKIVPFKGNIRNYLTVDGYTKLKGAPTKYMVKLNNRKQWYRVMTFCVSNSGTLFVKTKSNPFLVVKDYELDSL